MCVCVCVCVCVCMCANDECMLLVPHRESQPADQSMHNLSAPTAARPNRQVFFSPIPITLLLKPAKSSSAEPKVVLVINISTDSSNTFSTTNSHSGANPGLATTPNRFYCPANVNIASTPTPSRSFANMSQAVQFCALLEKSPGRFQFTGCSAPLGFKCVSRIQQTPSLTERSGRRFLTGDLAGLFSK